MFSGHEMNNPPGQDLLQSPDKVVSALVRTPIEEDLCSLEAIFSRSNWRLQKATSSAHALALLEKQTYSVVLYGAEKFPGDWQSLMAATRESQPRPRIITMARFSEAHRWGELLDAGVHDILPTPLDNTEVVQVVGFAWLLWKREWLALQAAPILQEQAAKLAAARRARYRHSTLPGIRYSQGAAGA